jgi:NitT/TauT family transport system substrate-binding protein
MGENGLEFMKWVNREYPGGDLSFVPYTGSLVPFIEKKVDAMQCFATAEPVQLELDGVANTVFIIADTGYNPYETVIAVNDDFLKKHPEKVNAFIDSLRKGWKAYLASPRKTNTHMHTLNPDMTMKVLEVSCSLLAKFVQSDVTEDKDIGWMTQERWDQLGKQLVEIDILTEESVKKIGTPFFNPPLVPGS